MKRWFQQATLEVACWKDSKGREVAAHQQTTRTRPAGAGSSGSVNVS
ncbi:hypothetical protein [Deinococcus cellulosilyticus]